MKVGRRTSLIGLFLAFQFPDSSADEKGGEDRNRTYPGPQNEPTTVLKTARATRHRSLSEKGKFENQKARKKSRACEKPPGIEVPPPGLGCSSDFFPGFRVPDSLGFDLLDLPNDFVEVRPFAGFQFRMDLFAIGGDFEGAAARGDKRERRDPIAEFENLGRQTDGLRRVVSDDAILDPDFGFHRSLLSASESNDWGARVKRRAIR